jgi:hypothetical protein
MKSVTSFSLSLAAAVLIALASATIATATGTDTCAGESATIGGTCTPLTNTASGSNANAAFGSGALEFNTSGAANTATGVNALQGNTLGDDNTATGAAALVNNTVGSDNTATGESALVNNMTGGDNTATGFDALFNNSAGGDNTAAGVDALLGNTTGSSNIALGSHAGGNLTTGDNNIDIGNAGVAAESNAIRIGTQGTQTATFIAGIFGTPKIKKACQVVVESTGLVGCVKSSARYKHDIRDMGDASDRLMKLRPVTFRYKADSTGTQQYGLIAEEVEKVYPELVVDGADGKPETVEYQVLPAMLLNEVQKQSRANQQMARQLARKDAQITALQRQMASLAERLGTLERQATASRPDRMAAATQ